MADVSETVSIKDAAKAISQGKRHLLVRDYNLAVVALAQAYKLFIQEHGETGDETDEQCLLYARAFLGPADEKAGVLGGGVPRSEETSQDEEAQEEETQEDEVQDEDEDEDAEEEATITTCPPMPEDKNNSDTKEQPNGKESNDTAIRKDEKMEESNKVNGKKIEKIDKRQRNEIPGCSRDPDINSECSSLKKAEDDSESVEKENEEEDMDTSQLAWEMIQVAQRGPSEWEFLAEAYRHLGNIAITGGKYEFMLTDLRGCLDSLHKMSPNDHRAIIEIHYQFGLVHALASNFDASIEQFKQASTLLEERIVYLQDFQDEPALFLECELICIIAGGIKAMQKRLSKIQDTITAIKYLKREADVIMEIKEKTSNDAAESNEANGNDHV